MKLITLEVLLNPEWEKEHEFEMLLKYRWAWLHVAQRKMWKPRKSNHDQSGEIAPVLCYILLSRKYHPSVTVHSILKRHTQPIRLLYMHMSWESCARSSISELCDEERARDMGLPIPHTAGLTCCEWYLLHVYDFVKWIFCFLLQPQSQLFCHAGQVVIEQKIESKKEEIGWKDWRRRGVSCKGK